MLNEEYQKYINDIIILIENYCISKNYDYRNNYPYFIIDVPELKREKRLTNRFIIHIKSLENFDSLTLLS